MKAMRTLVSLSMIGPTFRVLLIALAFLAIVLSPEALVSQVTGEPGPEDSLPPERQRIDTVFRFDPVRPLVDSNGLRTQLSQAFGLSLLFSGSGYGLGFFYERSLSSKFSGLIELGFTGARKGDEFQVFNYDPNSVHFQSYFVPNKVNRVWQSPIMIAAKYRLFTNVFFNNFRPFLTAGLGGTLVMTTPYDQEFFNAFGDAQFYGAPGGFLGAGAEFTPKTPGVAFNLRYYYLPIDPGIESIRDDPITNFGGVFLSLSLPF